MLEVINNALEFRFPQVHGEARCRIDFQRTLRIPDDNQAHSLPAGLGRFPLFHVQDYWRRLPASWVKHGGVFLPMYQAEALWINFSGSYPCAVKVAAGKINAINGHYWQQELSRNDQDYAVLPEQPWLDGFNVTQELVRQFVAMPLGGGYSAEEQILGRAENGGIQILVFPMRAEAYDALQRRKLQEHLNEPDADFMIPRFLRKSAEMGLAPGGLMRQKIYEDPHGVAVWDEENGARCFVHLLNSEQFTQATGKEPPATPVTAKAYKKAGIPWFDYYADMPALGGSKILSRLSSVASAVVAKTRGALGN